MAAKCAAIDMNSSKFNRTFRCDFALEAFAMGINKRLLPASEAVSRSLPLIVRGMSASSKQWIYYAKENNLPFYYIDSGYFGNQKTKKWHRITYNELQNTNTFRQRDTIRLSSQLWNWQESVYKSFTPGSKILICPPSIKVMNFFNQPSPQLWTENIIKQIKQYTNRPIEVRLKPSRTDRQTVKSIRHALEDNVHCLVTYNSIAATEALMIGKPAITLGPNAAQSICETDLKNIENPKTPSESKMYSFLTHLSYCQFTVQEMKDGVHWDYIKP